LRLLPCQFRLVFLAACIVGCGGDSKDGGQGKAPPQIDADTAVAELQPVYFDPIAVGFEFDGVLTENGTLAGYWIEDEFIQPTMYLVFASDEYFSASSEDVETAQSCVGFGIYNPVPRSEPLPTIDGAELFHSFEGTFIIEYYTCAGLIDPEIWGPDGIGLINRFQDMQLGMGFGVLTDNLSGVWSDEVLDEYEPNMLATYFAFNSPDGEFVAEDLTTCFAWEYHVADKSFTVDDEGYLLPVTVSDLMPPQSLPEMYVRNIATWYPLFDDIDFDAL